MKILTNLLGICLATLFMAGVASAADSTLSRIKTAGKVRVAIDLGIPPWAYVDEQLEKVGSEVDTAKLLAKDLGVELEIVSTTGANRVPFLLTGKADLIVSTLGITDQRKKMLLFSIPYSGANNIVAAPADMNISSFTDLSGKTIAVTRGGMLDTGVTAGAPKDTTIQRFEDESTTMTAVVTGQVSILGQTASNVAQINARNPALKLEQKFVIDTVYYGIAMPLGDTETKTWLDSWIKKNLDNGKLAEIYHKHHDTDLPPAIFEAKDR